MPHWSHALLSWEFFYGAPQINLLLYSSIFAFWYFQAFSAMLIGVFVRQKEVLQAYSAEFQKNLGSQELGEALNRNSSEQLLKAPSHWGISGSSDGNHWIVFQGDASYDNNSPTVSLKLPCQHFSELTEITGIDLTYLNFLPPCDSLQK